MNAGALLARLDRGVRLLLPTLLTLVAVLISVLSLPILFFDLVAPSLALVSVYYWTVTRPQVMPSAAVFLIGFVQDAVTGVPLGVNAFVLLAVHGVLLSQRRFLAGRPFWVFWWGFVILVPCATLVTWLLVALLRGAFFAPVDTLFAMTLTVAVFPLLSWFLFHVHRMALASAPGE